MLKSAFIAGVSCTFLISAIFHNKAQAQVPAKQWEKMYGGTGQDVARSIVPTNDGGYVMAGNTVSYNGDVVRDAAHSASMLDMWVVKMNATGGIDWQKLYGGSSFEHANCIRPTSGGYVIAGYASSTNGDVSGFHTGTGNDMWVLKITETGTIVWAKCLGGADDEMAYSIRETSNGNFIVVGYTKSTEGDISLPRGDKDVWVVCLSAAGSPIWKKNLGGTGAEEAFDLETTSDGGCVLIGYTTSNNDDVSGNHGKKDLWLVKVSASGGMDWQKTYGGSEDDEGIALRKTTDGFIASGYTASSDGDLSQGKGNRDAWILKLSNTGNIIWQKTYGGTLAEEFRTIEIANGGYIAGGFSNSADGDVQGGSGMTTEYWLAKIGSTGSLTWQKTFGGNSNEEIQGIAKANDGGYLMAGASFSSNISGYHGGNAQDCWFVKLAKDESSNAVTETTLIEKVHVSTTGRKNTWSLIAKNSLSIRQANVVNLHGQRSAFSETNGVDKKIISLDGLASGIYLLQILLSDGSTYSHKLSVQ